MAAWCRDRVGEAPVDRLRQNFCHRGAGKIEQAGWVGECGRSQAVCLTNGRLWDIASRRPAVGYVVNLIAQIGLGRQREAAQRNVAPNILEVGDARFVSESGSRARVILSSDSDSPNGV